MTRLLASIADLGEMEAAREGGADIVDLKDPTRGALGAWAPDRLEAAVALWRSWDASRPDLSATIGDQPMRPDAVLAAAQRTAETGVPLVKVGFTAGRGAAGCIAALAPIARRTRLVAVLFADQDPDLALIDRAADAGFFAAMLDTADKKAGSLTSHMDQERLAAFLARARGRRLVTGLAGSLSRADIAALAAFRPDYLGFRGALCRAGRESGLDPAAMAAIRNEFARAASYRIVEPAPL